MPMSINDNSYNPCSGGRGLRSCVCTKKGREKETQGVRVGEDLLSPRESGRLRAVFAKEGKRRHKV